MGGCAVDLDLGGIGQVDPTAVFDLAPLGACGVGVFRNDVHDIILLVGIDHKSALHRVIKGIENIGSYLTLVADSGAGDGLLRGIVGHSLAVTCAPMRIQCVGLHALIQLGNLLTAGGIGVPAFKLVARVCRFGLNIGDCCGIVALSLDLTFAAIGIKANKRIIVGQIVVVNTIEVHIGLCQAALDQHGNCLTAGSAPLAKGKQQIGAGPAFYNSGLQGAGLRIAQPAAATVKAQGNKRIEHTLGKGQAELIDKIVHFLFVLLQVLKQQLLSFFLGNAIGVILVQLAFGNTGTVAHGPLLVIPVGLCSKALPHLNDIHTFLAHGKLRRSLCRDGSHRNQCDQQGNCQGNANNSFLHRCLLLSKSSVLSHGETAGKLCHILEAIIADFHRHCNPQIKINYTFVTNYTRKMFPDLGFDTRNTAIFFYFPLDNITSFPYLYKS